MRRIVIGVTAAVLALALGVLLVASAQAGSSQSAPTKYSHNPNGKLIRSVAWTRPVAVREFSSSRTRSPRGAPPR
jgi:hypothetical protein